MASTQAVAASTEVKDKPRKIAGVIIAGHGFQHMYADGFLVLLPSVYAAFGLTPVSAGALSTVRQASSGLLSMGGGFVIDMFAGRRGMLLAASLFTMGLGYLLVAAATNYVLLLIALGIGSAASSFWHPIGLGILSTSFPRRRAFMMSLHRSAGGIGESVTPVVVWLALFVITWRQVLVGGFLLISIVAAAIFIVLARLGLEAQSRRQSPVTEKRSALAQFRSIGSMFKDRALPTLLLVSGFRGMADRALIFFLPLYIMQSVGEDDPLSAEVAGKVALVLVLMSVMSIIVPPFIGLYADRIGRKPVMLATLSASLVITTLLAFTTGVGIAFYVLIAAFGAVRFAVTNITQAASLDIAEGKRLEGSMIGLLWGNNALFGSFSPLIAGALISILSTGTDDFSLIFPYVAVLTLVAVVTALFLPSGLGRPQREEATPASA